MADLHMDKRGELGGGIMQRVVAIIVGIVGITAAAIPVVVDTTSSANVSGTTGTILDLVPLFLGIAAMVLATRMFS
jgi:hypothetical protein